MWPFTHPVYLVVTSFFLCVWGGLPSQRRHSQWGSCSRVDRFEWVGWGPWLVVTSSSDYFQSGLYSKLAFVLSVERYFSVVRPFNQLRNRCLYLVLRTKRAVLLSFLCTFLDFHAVKFFWDLLRFCWGFYALRWLWPSLASSSPSSSPSPTTSCSAPCTSGNWSEHVFGPRLTQNRDAFFLRERIMLSDSPLNSTILQVSIRW